jgi:hypothetical protein
MAGEGRANQILFISTSIPRSRRYFEDDALVFIRECRVQVSTGLPGPLRRSPVEIQYIWEVFYAFLSQYFNRKEFAPPETSRILQEVIRASTGTMLGFVASLVFGVENLTKQLFEEQSSDTDPELKSLLELIRSWGGNAARKNGLLGFLSTPSTASLLYRLEKHGVVTGDQIKIWKELRPNIAHGDVIDYADEKTLAEPESADRHVSPADPQINRI